MKFLTNIRYTKSQRIAISFLISFLLLIELAIWAYDSNKKPVQTIKVPEELAKLQNQIDASENTFNAGHPASVTLQKFNPNDLDKNGWMQLGFSDKQVKTILKYKNSLGGDFTSLEQIRNCFVISEEKFNEISPFIVLKPGSGIVDGGISYARYSASYKLKRFNPNDYSQKDWTAIGFSEKQAATILKYKRSLGGKFTTPEQIKSCFVISEEKFNEIKPFIVLPEAEKSQHLEKPSADQPKVAQLKKFNPNELNREQWQELGFTGKQINTIFNYKRSLGGKFKDAATLKRCYSISEDKFAELEPYLIFD